MLKPILFGCLDFNRGDQFDWNSLASITDTVFDDIWNGWDPVVQHRLIVSELSYPNAEAISSEVCSNKESGRTNLLCLSVFIEI